MPTITYTQPNGTQQTLEVAEGTTLMRAAVSNGITGIIGECGGQAMCATCHVYVRPEYAQALPEIREDEDEMLDCAAAERTDRSRLACQIKIDAELAEIVVDIPAGQL
ncbi:2Fe-2S iron-sulfur cluster-binding protein [Arthrobacter sp. efr-133-TYG-118]|uniref:2Fe-2S iron-sulfur cluster-binding protein n=1 Tax=Arthrobacter sp. efr-133-TYG-118 TaxID=3040279 RepID=UPI002551813C|nr:2Fe-2S iron-sulfur cluster-binding protein [Arthrobacter sp. efr-133-TYG-118]